MSEDERKQLLELYIEAELARKIQELKDTGGFDSDKQVIIRAIENYHERMKFNQEQHIAVQETILDKGFITVGDDEIGHAIKFLKERPTSNELEYSEITKFYGNYNIGLINSFYNRLLPVKYALLVLLKLHLEKESEWITLDDFKHEMKEASKSFVYRTNAIIGDDEEFSDVNLGFPKVSSDKNNKLVLSEKQIIELDKSMSHFIRKCVGAFVKNREKTSFTMKGGCFELGMINAKVEIERDAKPKVNSKKKVYVSLNEFGQEFVKQRNPFLDYISASEKDDSVKPPNSIFSKDEANFYLEKILSKFKFEDEFVRKLIETKEYSRTDDIKDEFKKMYEGWLESNHPDAHKEIKEKMVDDKSDFTRINSLVIMARLIELGIFEKDPNSRFGPYYLTKEWQN